MPIGQNESEMPYRIEPFTLRSATGEIASLLIRLGRSSAILENALHSATASQLANAVRVMNCYYSNLIEGHNTRPREIEQALKGEWAGDTERRNLQYEARAHIRVQAEIDRLHAQGSLPDPTSAAFLRWIHREFFQELPREFLHMENVPIVPGQWRAELPEVAVGLHQPPSFPRIPDFMAYFEAQYRSVRREEGANVLSIAAAHHRLNYIHPFRDGNGRVSRLMSHAMLLDAGLGAHGLWSISRGLARGLANRAEYKLQMNNADTPRQGDMDGRGNLSARALREFTRWFLAVCVDQIEFMTGQFEFRTLAARLTELTKQDDQLPKQSAPLLRAILREGELTRAAAQEILGMPERSARRVTQQLLSSELVGSQSAKGPLHLRFPQRHIEQLFPRLY